MRTFALTSILLCVFYSSHSQNLVINGSFENYTNCPYFGGTWSSNNPSYVTGWANVNNHEGSPDMYNPCDPYQSAPWPSINTLGAENAQDGNSYAGLYITKVGSLTNWREYLVASFSTPLTAGTMYILSFYVSLADKSMYGTNKFGWYFSNGIPSINTAGMTTSQLHRNLEFHGIYASGDYNGSPIMQKNGWTLITGQYTAVGGETNVTIGNFTTTSNSTVETSSGGTVDDAYYFVDNVSLVPVTPLSVELEGFNAICNDNKTVKLIWKMFSETNNDYFTIEKSLDGYNWEYLCNVDGDEINHNDSYYMYSTPTFGTNTFNYFRLSQTDLNGNKKVLDVISAPECNKLTEPQVYVTGEKQLIVNTKDIFYIDIFDMSGRKIIDNQLLNNTINILNLSNFANGIYQVKLSSGSGDLFLNQVYLQ